MCKINTAQAVSSTEKRKRIDAAEIADASRNTSGTGCWRTIRITIAKVSLWIGFCFPLVAFADAIQFAVTNSLRRVVEIRTDILSRRFRFSVFENRSLEVSKLLKN